MATRLDSLGAPSGGIVQTVYSEITTGNSVSTTVAIPTSGTIDQTMGAQILTATITPTSASNYLMVVAQMDSAIGGATGIVAMLALYRDSGNAVAYGSFYTNSYLYGSIPIIYRVIAGSTTATTFKLRGGPHSGGNTAVFGGALNGPSYPGGTGTIGGAMVVYEVAA